MSTLGSLVISSDINHIHTIERSRQNDCSSFQSKDLSDVRCIGEMDGVWELDPDTSITRDHR